MAKDSSVLAIDVGSGSLKMAEFTYSAAGAITLSKFAYRKLEPPAEGVENPSFRDLFHDMIAEKHFTARGVRLSISGQNSFQRLSRLPAMLSGKAAISKVVEFEARQTVPYAMNEVEWDYQLIRHDWEETRLETNEDGTTSEIVEPHEEYEALFIAVKTDQITEYTDVIQDSGREVLSVEIAPVALFNAAKAAQIRDDECVLMLNIGGIGSNLMIADHNRAFIRSIPIAGDAVTSQIAKEFGIGFAEAEELKRRHGFVALGGAYEEPESELEATISKIARNVMTRLHGEISRSINVWRAQHGGNAPSRVLLSGGGATMRYITDFFQEKLRLPVEYLNTFSTVTIGPDVDRELLQAVAPMCQELIGLSLRSVSRCPIDISLEPRFIRNQKELDRKKPYFYAAAVLLVVCLAIFAGGVAKLLDFNQRRIVRVDAELQKANSKAAEIDGLMGKLRSAQSEYNEVKNYLDRRNQWFAMLQELQTIIPDLMWITYLDGEGDAPVADAGSMDMMMMDPLFGPAPSAASKRKTTGKNQPGFDTNRKTLKEISDLREIKKIRLEGYTVILGGKVMLEKELRSKLENSRFFTADSELERYDNAPGGANLTSFKLVLTLKEPIRK